MLRKPKRALVDQMILTVVLIKSYFVKVTSLKFVMEQKLIALVFNLKKLS